mmetsp:Transcript_25913/g.54763  ORF Transcript_25913/g.54763 Transcript_25913/m.54763 type:complete len:131 (+) Transcript_25913:811-1203(+)
MLITNCNPMPREDPFTTNTASGSALRLVAAFESSSEDENWISGKTGCPCDFGGSGASKEDPDEEANLTVFTGGRHIDEGRRHPAALETNAGAACDRWIVVYGPRCTQLKHERNSNSPFLMVTSAFQNSPD